MDDKLTEMLYRDIYGTVSTCSDNNCVGLKKSIITDTGSINKYWCH